MNIKPANRLSELKEYYFSTKLKEIAQMRTEGKDIINLGIGSPDLPPSEKVVETLCEEAKKSNTHGYQSYTGIPELREAFAKWYQKYFNITLNPNNEIQPLIGSKEGIIHITLAFVNPHDEVLVPNPGYPTYTSASRLAEAKIRSYNLTEKNGWYPNLEELEKTDLSKVKLMWVNYPNMPTGTKATKSLFEKLVKFGKKHNIVICNDNPYSFVLNDEQLSIFSVEGAKDICLELNSLSKSHNMAGWRIAMLAGNKTFIDWILKVKSNIDSGMFRPMMLGAVKALEQPQSWYDNNNKIYRQRRQLAYQIMDILNCKYDKNQVGMFVWGKIPTEIKSTAEFSDKILYESNVFITPGFIFGSNGERYIRISLCSTIEKLEEAKERIKNKLK